MSEQCSAADCALAHVLWLPNGYSTMNQTSTLHSKKTQTLIHKKYCKNLKKNYFSIHYELLNFCKGGDTGLLGGSIWSTVHCPLSTVHCTLSKETVYDTNQL